MTPLPSPSPAFDQGVDQSNLVPARPSCDFRRRDVLPFKLAVDPRDEQEIPSATVQHGCPREEEIRERVADGADAELVHRVALAEELDHLLHAPAFGFVVVEPRKDRGHLDRLAGCRSREAVRHYALPHRQSRGNPRHAHPAPPACVLLRAALREFLRPSRWPLTKAPKLSDEAATESPRSRLPEALSQGFTILEGRPLVPHRRLRHEEDSAPKMFASRSSVRSVFCEMSCARQYVRRLLHPFRVADPVADRVRP